MTSVVWCSSVFTSWHFILYVAGRNKSFVYSKQYCRVITVVYLVRFGLNIVQNTETFCYYFSNFDMHFFICLIVMKQNKVMHLINCPI